MTNDLTVYESALVPVGTVQDFLAAYQLKKEIIEGILREGVDYGAVPGTDKPTLKKGGAEKMVNFYALHPTFEDVVTEEDWTGADHSGEQFFYYRQRCNLYKEINGARVLVASADGSCNSWEKKYRYRWVSEFEIPADADKTTLKTQGGRNSEFAFAVDKAETSGKYGKPASYWKSWADAIASGKAIAIKRKTSKGTMMDAWEMDATVYAIPNRDVAEQVNTILKMAQKRALVAATLIATNTSDYFTQDMEDFVQGEFVEVEVKSETALPAKPHPDDEQPAKELIDPMGEWAVKEAATRWNIATAQAAKAIAEAKLGKRMEKADFLSWLADKS